jgi:hypothetical protein
MWQDLAVQDRKTMRWRNLVSSYEIVQCKILADRGRGFIATRAESTQFVLVFKKARHQFATTPYFFPRREGLRRGHVKRGTCDL